MAKTAAKKTEKVPETATESSYPRPVTLRDSRKLTLRLMGPKDRDLMVEFARGLPADDLLFLRTNITEPAAVERWLANIASGRSISVLAIDGDVLAGYASVHLMEATWQRHIGEIRLLSGPAYRGAGLGRILASEAYTVARSLGLQKLTAQMTIDQTGARKTFDSLGFRAEALLTDWVIAADGSTRDLIVMAYDLAGLTDRLD